MLPKKTLHENFESCENLLALYLTSLAGMLMAPSSFPRILRLVPAGNSWRIGEIVPASPEYLPDGMHSVQQLLKEALPDEPYTLNAFMVVLKKDRQGSQSAFLVMIGDTSGETATFGAVPGADWREVDETVLQGLLGLDWEDSPNQQSPRYQPTVRRLQQLLEQALPVGFTEQSHVLAKQCLAAALPLTTAALAEVLDEVHMGVVTNLESSRVKMTDLQAAVQRAVKAKDRQYTRLFRDYEKVQLQAQGFQNRIQQLQAELKKVGQRKVMPGATGVTGESLALRLDALF